jgi:hypothetical protein
LSNPQHTEEHLNEKYVHENVLILVTKAKVNKLSICISIANVNLSVYLFSIASFHPLLISVEKMNLFSSSIYMHRKTNSIKRMQSLILGVCGSQHISVFSGLAIIRWMASLIMLMASMAGYT